MSIGNLLSNVIGVIKRTLTGTEDFTAAVAARRELRVVAVAAVNLIRLRSELFVDQRDAAHIAQEARFMPVFVFVAQVLLNGWETKLIFDRSPAATHLGIDSNDCVALLASVGKDSFVALDAVRMFVSQHVALAGEALVAVPAAEMPAVPVLRHGFCVFATKN